MPREATFNCADCGETREQTQKGGRPKVRCPDCQKKFMRQYHRNYYRANRTKPTANVGS